MKIKSFKLTKKIIGKFLEKRNKTIFKQKIIFLLFELKENFENNFILFYSIVENLILLSLRSLDNLKKKN